MKLNRAVSFVSLSAVLAAAPAVFAQMPPPPKPGPEHQLFKQDEGTWDATVESYMAPGAPPMTSKAVETNTVACGGLCMLSNFKGEFGGAPFDGHGTTTFDATKKKYVGSWTDSMSTGLMIGESTYDSAKKTLTGYMEGPDESGKVTKMKSVVEYKADGSRVFTMYMNAPDGKEVAAMKITYTKRK